MQAALGPVRLQTSCGPLNVCITADDEQLACVARAYFDMYGDDWPLRPRVVRITLTRIHVPRRASGSFLTCAHMSVDCNADEYTADTQHGFVAAGHTGPVADEWTICVPPQTSFGEPEIGDMEDLFSLICTVGWRAERFIAVHAGAVVKNDVCAVLCAPSGGGKSTLTAALVLNGWSTLGDDKLLLRDESGVPVLRALLHTFNLDPEIRRWFEVGDVRVLPRYSAWTQKRRVPLDRLRLHARRPMAHPTHVVSITRSPQMRGIRASRLDAPQTVAALLRQIVLPSHVNVGRWIVTQAARCASNLHGVQLEIGEDAYAQPDWLRTIEAALK